VNATFFERKAELLKDAYIQAQLRADAMKALGEDEWEDGTVLFFKKRFSPTGKEYDYAVLKTDGLWYTTGPRSPKGYNWEELIGWMLQGGLAEVDIFVASEWKHISEV
jgi:hypothetical protein